MAQTPKIAVDSLYKIFGPQPERAYELVSEGHSKTEIKQHTDSVVALRDITFSVNEGEIFVIMGLSGSGKSTLLRCINRLKPATYGTVTVNNKDVMQLSQQELIHLRRKVFGMVFQHFGLLPHKTVLDNVRFGLEINKIRGNEAEQRAQEALERVGLGGWGASKVDELSGGMQQRVGLARALAIDPEILLMDEPFSALDPLIRTEMQDELLRLHQEMQKTILFVTHDLNEAIRVGDRIGILNSEGTMVQIDTPEQILLHPANEYVESFIGDVDKPAVIRIESVMKRPTATVSYTATVNEATRTMEEQNTHFCFVIQNNSYKGLLRYEDLVEVTDTESITAHIQTGETADPLHTIKDIIPYVIRHHHPMPVVNQQQELIGEISQQHVLTLLEGGSAYES